MALLIMFTVSSWVGDLLLSVLVPDRPGVLLVLSDRLRNFALVSPLMDVVPFYAIALVRIMAPYPCWFLIGRWYGDAALRWTERRSPSLGRFFRWAESIFGKVAIPAVVLVPMNMVCALAGASGMALWRFVALKAIGSLLILTAIRQVGWVFAGPLTAVSTWIGDHRLLVFVICACGLALGGWWERRFAGGTDVDHLVHLDEEILELSDSGSDADPPQDRPGHGSDR